MRPGSQLPELIDALHLGLLKNAQPTLLIGSGCSREAGIPPVDELIMLLGEGLDKADKLPPGVRQSDGQFDSTKVLEALRDLSNLRRRRIVDPLIDVPVSSAYQGLATIAAAGFFKVILTTTVDTLLERALNGVGLRPGFGLEIADATSGTSQLNEGSLRPDQGVLVGKLRGDIAEGTAVLDPKQQKWLIRKLAKPLQHELKRLLVVVGYEGEMPSLIDLLQTSSRHELWWVSNTSPPQLPGGRPVRFIEGDDADPERFFGMLAYHLIQRPVDQRLTASGDEPSLPTDLPTSSGDDPTDADYLSSLLRNSEAVSRSLRWSVPPAQNAQVQSQLEYQNWLTSKVEGELASTSNPAWVSIVAGLLAQVLQHVSASPRAGDSVESFVESQLNAVKREDASDHPNEPVVSAATVATVNLLRQLDLLGDSELLRSLERASSPDTMTSEQRRG